MEHNQESGHPSVRQRFQHVTADQFREQVMGLIQAEEAIRNTIAEAVENGWLTPPQGVEVIAGTTRLIFGGEVTTLPSVVGDLATTLQHVVR